MTVPPPERPARPDADESAIAVPRPFDFRKHGHAMVDWIADYLEQVERFPVQSTVAPGWVRSQLPADPPPHGEPWERIAADVDRVILPGITHWQSPNFFGYFPANASGPAILGELLSAGLGVQGMLWSTSPACTELETHVLDWLAGMLGLPAHFRSDGPGGGVIQDTASSATLCALIAARERATGFAGGEKVAFTIDGIALVTALARSDGSVTVSITAANDAPTLAAGHTHTLASTNEDTASPATLVSALLAIGTILNKLGSEVDLVTRLATVTVVLLLFIYAIVIVSVSMT